MPLSPKQKKVGGIALAIGAFLLLTGFRREEEEKPTPSPRPYVEPEYGTYTYIVQRWTPTSDESATGIAKKLIGDPAYALWIFDLNYAVFPAGNINWLPAGAALQIPTAESVNALRSGKPAVFDDFKRRYRALVAAYTQICARPLGRGTQDCTKNAIISVGSDVSNPTVETVGLSGLSGLSRAYRGLGSALGTSPLGIATVTGKFRLTARAKAL